MISLYDVHKRSNERGLSGVAEMPCQFQQCTAACPIRQATQLHFERTIRRFNDLLDQ